MSHFRSSFGRLAEFTVLSASLAAFQVAAWAAAQQQTSETPAQAVARALARHGSQWALGIADWTADGTITMFTADGSQATFDMTLMRKGSAQVQRIIREPAAEIRQGSDGSLAWNSIGGWFVSRAQGHGLWFLESQTARSVQELFKNTAQLQLSDVDVNSKEHVIEARDNEERKTRYSVDASTSTITRLEFVTGQSMDPFSRGTVSNVEKYLFSDYRVVSALLTPFKVERYIDGIKAEEMRFRSVRYNTSLTDDRFRP